MRYLFESYLKCGSLSELEQIAESKKITHKRWITAKGIAKGGKPLKTSALHRLLHEKLYLGMIENKNTGESYKGKHQAIVSKDLWEAVQKKLKENDISGNHTRSRNDNLLTGKLFDTGGTAFVNQANSKRKTTKKHYYAVKGLYLPTEQIDELAQEAVTEILNADLSNLPKETAMALKQINFSNMDYFKQRSFVRNFINKVIYGKDKLTFFCNTDCEMLAAYTSDYLNPNAEPLEFINDFANRQIIYEKAIVINRGLSSNTYNAGKVGLMSVNDNNRLIVRAFAYAWRYKKLYESGMPTNEIAKQENISKRTIYKYLNIAYLSPNLVNQLLDGTMSIPLQKLFKVASEDLCFKK